MSARPKHCCAVCPALISLDLLMCATHWRKVPLQLQGKVYRTLRAVRRASNAQVALAARRDYLAAVADAIAAVTPPQPATPTIQGEAP